MFYQIDPSAASSIRKSGFILPRQMSARLSDFGVEDATIESLLIKLDQNADGYISAREFTLGYADYLRVTGDSQKIFHALCDDEEANVRLIEAQQSRAVEKAVDLTSKLSAAQQQNDAAKTAELESAIAEEKAKAQDLQDQVAVRRLELLFSPSFSLSLSVSLSLCLLPPAPFPLFA